MQFSLCLWILKIELIIQESCPSCFLQECVWECSWQCVSLPAMFWDGKVNDSTAGMGYLVPATSDFSHEKTLGEIWCWSFALLSFLDANSTEFDPESKHPVVSLSIIFSLSYTGINWTCLFLQVIEMPEHNPGQMGGTMRLGKRRTIFKSDTSVMSM